MFTWQPILTHDYFKQRQRRQKIKPFTGQHQPPHNPNISGPELLMTLNNPNPFPTQATSNNTSNEETGEDYRECYREAFPMYDDEMPYSPESRLQGKNCLTLLCCCVVITLLREYLFVNLLSANIINFRLL